MCFTLFYQLCAQNEEKFYPPRRAHSGEKMGKSSKILIPKIFLVTQILQLKKRQIVNSTKQNFSRQEFSKRLHHGSIWTFFQILSDFRLEARHTVRRPADRTKSVLPWLVPWRNNDEHELGVSRLRLL